MAALAIPGLSAAIDFDPAFGGGPLATVIQDLSSILIYFAIATAVMRRKIGCILTSVELMSDG